MEWDEMRLSRWCSEKRGKKAGERDRGERKSERVRCYRNGRTIDATKRTNATLEKQKKGVYNEYL